MTRNTDRETQGGIMVSRNNLAVGGDSSRLSPSRDLGSSRKCTGDCQIFEQFEKEDGEEDIHFSVAMIMLSIEKSTKVPKEAIYSIEERQRILDLLKSLAL